MADQFIFDGWTMSSSANVIGDDDEGEWDEGSPSLANKDPVASFSQAQSSKIENEPENWEPETTTVPDIPTSTTSSSPNNIIACQMPVEVSVVEQDVPEKCFNWLSSASSSDKLDFLRQALTFFNKSDELERGFKIVVNAKKRLERKRKQLKVPQEHQIEKRAFLYEPKSGSFSEPAALQSAVSSEVVALQSAGPSKLPELRSCKKPVFQGFHDEDIIAVDCEFVRLINKPENQSHFLRCGTVSIVGYEGNSLYEGLVKIEPHSFVIDQYTIKANGIKNPFHFEKGTLFETLKKKVEEFFHNKLIVVCGGMNDFQCLNLNYGDYQKTLENPNQDVFDLNQHFQKWRKGYHTKHGVPIYEPLSLKSVYDHFYPGSNFQVGAHESKLDAEATMRIFREQVVGKAEIDWTNKKQYCVPYDDEPFDPFSEIVRLKD